MNNYEIVEKFVYLGAQICSTGGCSNEIVRRIALGHNAFSCLHHIWRSNEVCLTNKWQILQATVFSVVLYGCETWTYLKEDSRRLSAFSFFCYRRIFGISWQQKVSNESIKFIVTSQKGNFVDLAHTEKRRKLRWFGHVARMNSQRLPLSILNCTLQGTRPRGRPRRRWTDDITDWLVMTLEEARKKAQNREE